MQSKKRSFKEAIVNTFIGMMITFTISPFLYWIHNVKISYPVMGSLTISFTIVSIIRNYIIRRIFNKKEK